MKIVSYNIHKGMDSNNKITLGKISKYLKNINADVICLQEVLYPQFAKLKLDLKMDGVFAANVIRPSMMYGICIFSNKEIYNNEHILLTSKNEQRGFVNANILSEFGKMNIVNTHLGLDRYERQTQINEILSYLYNREGKSIICGDFNEKNISLSNYNDMAVFTGKYDICTFFKTEARIDYIFIDNLIKIEDYVIDKIKLSDHYPIIGKI
ncbi:endonuclease/exonuclease/phosphatase family protein [[Clostridium] dakarense]|uniref:endonuclease/exonuclease/phosphatase family protein n=1 Tax=Faecalimicrobium dakarense TaxID=1301100 RepID=UPI0004BA41A8|nr:endonuclease/exonuclease/phosphatase family protein [[Clostridium] dakarense]